MMLLTDLAPYVALAVTILVWVFTQRANRQHELFKERTKRRVDLFDGLLPEMAQLSEALERLNKNLQDQDARALADSTCKKLAGFRVKMLCYGTDDERRAYEEFIDAINQKDQERFPRNHNCLVDLARKNLRRELGIK
jgi:Flp pilus assembly protein TadB